MGAWLKFPQGLALRTGERSGIDVFQRAKLFERGSSGLVVGIDIGGSAKALKRQYEHVPLHGGLPHAPAWLRIVWTLIDDLGQSIHELHAFPGAVGPFESGAGF